MFKAIRDFFYSGNFLPHGHCFLWQPDILWLHIVSDAAIMTSYFSIPFVLIYFIRKRKDLPFPAMFLLFGAFILLCGTTHFMSIWVLWHPDYAVEGVIKALTALVSIFSFFLIVKLIPQALLLQSPAQLAGLNEELRATNHKLEMLYEQSKEGSQSRVAAIVDNIIDGIIAINEKGNIESFNKACEKIFGYRSEEVIGHNIKMLMPEPYHNEHDGYLQHYRATAEAKIIGTAGREVSGKRKDGLVFPMDLSVSAFYLDGKRHFSGIIRDITERKKSEEMLRLLGAIVESSDDVIISKTLDGIVSSWNNGAEKLFGYSTTEAMGKDMSFLIPPDKLQEEVDIINSLREGKTIDHLETVRLNKIGKRIDVSLTISPIRDIAGQIMGASKVGRDITYRKEAEAKLFRYMLDLERSNKDLDDFAYIASHDLKEPLRGLFNNAKFLQQDYADKLDQAGVAKLQRLGYLCQRMEQLVNDLLYFSRLGRQELAIQLTDMNLVVQDIKSLIDSPDVTINIPQKLPEIICDKLRVMEALRNLITNAIKYNDKKSKVIEIGIKDKVEIKNGVEHQVFYVKDNGIGIEEEFFEDIFRIFKRLNEEDDDKKGTGVGLTFVRKIIERHGGRIWLASAPGKGTTFYFTIKQQIH